MSFKKLLSKWQDGAATQLTDETVEVRLSADDAARLDALAEMFPQRTREQLIIELVSAGLAEIESSFPYVQGTDVVANDEFGDPIYKDVGPTPHYLDLMKKHADKYRRAH